MKRSRRGDVEVAIAVEVPGLRAEHTGQIGEPMLGERERARGSRATRCRDTA